MDESGASLVAVPIVDTVQRFPLPLIRDQHLEGIFGRLKDVIEARIANLEAARSSSRDELVRFWRYALDGLDHELHASIQRKYLREGRSLRISGISKHTTPVAESTWLKYIDPISWLEAKLRMCQRVGLNRCAPVSILDIGPGPGHFAFTARFYGHEVLGVEIPEEVRQGEEITCLYDDLCALHSVERIPYRIEAGRELLDLSQRFDMVTGLMAAFCNHPVRPGDRIGIPWDTGEWEHFIMSCRTRWLKTGGKIVLTLARDMTPDDVWAYLVSKASRTDRASYFVEITPR